MSKSRKPEFFSPHHLLVKALQKNKVDLLMIGVSGINYYAKDARQIISTGDYDIFIQPDVENLYRAIKVLLQEDCSVLYNPRIKNKLMPIHQPSKTLCKKLVDTHSVVVAIGPYQTVFEFVQEISGFTYDQMKRRATKMKDRKLGLTFLVGQLEDLLESKRIANREKDRLFLDKFKDLLLNS